MASYPLPDWLGPQPQVGQLFAQGARLGSEIKQQQNRLNQEATIANMHFDAQREAESRRARQADARLAVQKEMRTQQIGIQQAHLEEINTRLQDQIQKAARQHQAQQAYSGRVAQLTDGGMDQRDAQLQAFRELGPMMGSVPSGFASALKPPAARPPSNVDQRFSYEQAYKNFRDKWGDQIPNLDKLSRGDPDDVPRSRQSDVQQYKIDRADLQKMLGGISKAPGPTAGTGTTGGRTVKVGNYTITLPQDQDEGEMQPTQAGQE